MVVGEISTATYNWYDQATIIYATGTPANVITEMTAGANSQGTLQHREDIIDFNTYWQTDSTTTLCTAVWWSPKKRYNRLGVDGSGDWSKTF